MTAAPSPTDDRDGVDSVDSGLQSPGRAGDPRHRRAGRGRAGTVLVRLLPVWIVAVAITLGLSVERPVTAIAQAAPNPAPIDARAIYLRDCATCHGADATGTQAGPSLQGVGAASVDYWVSTGRMPLVGNARPAASRFGQAPPGQRLADPAAQSRRGTPSYSAAAITSLVNYVSSIAPGGPGIPTVGTAGADLAAGGEVFRLQCAACHEWAGVGGALYQREAPSLHKATPVQIAEAVRTGPGQMPAFGTSAVPPDQLSALVAYVRYLDHPQNRGGYPLWYIGPVAEGGLVILGGMGLLLVVSRWIGERT